MKRNILGTILIIKALVFIFMAVLMTPFALLNTEWFINGIYGYIHKILDEAEEIGLASKEEIDKLRNEA